MESLSFFLREKKLLRKKFKENRERIDRVLEAVTPSDFSRGCTKKEKWVMSVDAQPFASLCRRLPIILSEFSCNQSGKLLQLLLPKVQFPEVTSSEVAAVSF